MIQELKILYQDQWIIAINKPHGLLVHRSPIAKDATEFAMQILRNQIGGAHVTPIHRLDRKTSGVLLFALDKEIVPSLSLLFAEHQIQKQYLALVRGWTEAEFESKRPLHSDRGVLQEAFTKFKTLKHYETPWKSTKFPTSRYSLIQAFPKTGRYHQIRKHLNHLSHPIIADRPHGCKDQNRFFRQEYDMMIMPLHAQTLSFIHPKTNEKITIQAEIQADFQKYIDLLASNNLA